MNTIMTPAEKLDYFAEIFSRAAGNRMTSVSEHVNHLTGIAENIQKLGGEIHPDTPLRPIYESRVTQAILVLPTAEAYDGVKRVLREAAPQPVA